MKNNTLRDEFDAFSAVYDDITVNDLQYDAHKRIPEEMLKIKPVEVATVLDLGCGTGLSSKLFFDNDFQIHGVDISPGMLTQAKKLPFISLTCADFETETIHFATKFDYICCLGVMEFIHNPIALIEKCKALLNKNGILGITFPLNSYSEAEVPVFSYSPDEALSMIQNSGLVPLEIMLFTGYCMPDEDINYLGIICQ